MGDEERLRLVVGAGPESEDDVEVVERLVVAVEGFCADVAWRVSLESLGTCVVFGTGFGDDLDVILEGFCGFEKSTSSESLLEEVVLEDEELASGAAEMVTGLVVSSLESLSDDEVSGDEIPAVLGFESTDSLSDDEVSEEEDSALVCAAAGLGESVTESLSDDEVSEVEDASEGFDAFDFNFLA